MQIWIIIVQVHVNISGGAGVALRHAVRVRGVGSGRDAAGQQDEQHCKRHLYWIFELSCLYGEREAGVFPLYVTD